MFALDLAYSLRLAFDLRPVIAFHVKIKKDIYAFYIFHTGELVHLLCQPYVSFL